MKDINAMTVIALSLVKTSEKVDFELENSQFWGFSTKILLLYRGFPLTRFFLGPKNRVKGGVPASFPKYYPLWRNFDK